ncbi:MAG: hypothetical protein JJ896_03760 [Rhodothermales bacterium]|nr:hypothetical protein [Rhodothermales bacterium]MBO6778751.1 hypothetical protein [Rhodothermales bacterium]
MEVSDADQGPGSEPRVASRSVLAPIRRASDTIVRACDSTALTGFAAAAVIVGSWLSLVWPVSTLGLVLLGLVAAVLAMPGTVVFLLARAVAGVVRLPQTLMTQASGAASLPELSLKGGAFRSVWRAARYLLDVRGRLWSMKDELVAAGAVVRLASPVVLLSVLGAVVAIVAMLPIAVIMLLLALLF